MPPRPAYLRLIAPETGALLGLLAAGSIVGVGAVEASRTTAMVVALGLVVLVGLTRPKLLLVAALVSMAVTPNYWSGAVSLHSFPQIQKSLIWAAAAFMALDRGIEPRRLLPLAAYPLLGVISFLGGTPAAGLHPSQSLQTLASLSVAWAVFAIRWDWERDRDLLRVIAALPVTALLLGVILDVAGLRPLFDLASHPHRLQGALIPSGLGNGAILGFAAAVILARERLWRFALVLAAANVALVFGSVTRAAMISVAIVAIPSLWRISWQGLTADRPIKALQALTVAAVIAVSALAVLPVIQERNDQRVYIPGAHQVQQDASSGRFEAWSQVYKEAKVNLVFGRGLGAGPAIGATQEFFLAQHNEYLRLLLEGGYVGGILVLLAIVGSLAAAVREASPRIRPEVAALCLASATLALTDNPLTSPAYSVRLALIVAIAAGGRRLGEQRAQRTTQRVRRRADVQPRGDDLPDRRAIAG